MSVSTIHSLAYNRIEAYQYNLSHDLKVQTIEKKLFCSFEQLTNQNNIIQQLNI